MCSNFILIEYLSKRNYCQPEEIKFNRQMQRPVLCLYHQQVCVFQEAMRSAIDNQVILSESKYISIFIAGDPGSISGLGSSLGEEISYPLQYSWAYLVAQLVKNLPAMWETWIRSLGWEDPLEKGKATHSSILAWGIPCTV